MYISVITPWGLVPILQEVIMNKGMPHIINLTSIGFVPLSEMVIEVLSN